MVKFENIGYLWFFGLVVLLGILLIYSRKRRKNDISDFSGRVLAPKLLDGVKPHRRRLRENLLLLASLFLVIALIGPKVGQKLTEVKRMGVDVIIALDTSISMKAEDVTPNRLERAKYETGKFIDMLQGDRVGLVAFAGISYLHCPLTLDYSAAKLFLDAMDTGVIGTQGTALADAIETAMKAFPAEDKKHKVLVIVSDGEDHEGDIETAARKAREDGLIIYAVGAGSLTGAPIPIVDPNTRQVDFKRDRSGRVVTSTLEEGVLRQIASLTDGKYLNMSTNANVFGKIYDDILHIEKKELRTHEYSDYQSRYQVFLCIGLILLILEIILPEKRVKKEDRENE